MEAEKDDFEKGMAQCLVGMKVCQILNQNAGKIIDIFGIVTNAEGWKFYKLITDNRVYQSALVSFPLQKELLFGVLEMMLVECEKNLD